jgi:hypothetical protein
VYPIYLYLRWVSLSSCWVPPDRPCHPEPSRRSTSDWCRNRRVQSCDTPEGRDLNGNFCTKSRQKLTSAVYMEGPQFTRDTYAKDRRWSGTGRRGRLPRTRLEIVCQPPANLTTGGRYQHLTHCECSSRAMRGEESRLQAGRRASQSRQCLV